jgi:hypothetical protein
MSTATRKITCGAMPRGRAWQAGRTASWWSERSEAALNWVALGALLAAWNASDNDAIHTLRRPETLRGYTFVSVRAARIHAGESAAAPANR